MMRSWPVKLGLILLAGLSVAPAPAGAQAASSIQQLFKDGYAQQNRGNYTKALQIWNQVIQKNPDEPAAYVNRGITRYLMRDLRGAAGDLSEAIQHKDDYANAYFNRAVVLSDLKEYDAAIADYQRYLDLAPNAPDSVQARNMLESLRRRTASRPASPTAGALSSRPATSIPAQAPGPPQAPPSTNKPPAQQESAPAAPAAKPTPPPVPQVSETLPAVATPAPAATTAPSQVAATTPPVELRPTSVPLSKERSKPSTGEAAANPLPFRPLPPSIPPRTSPGAVSIGRISGYAATTDDLLLGLRLGVQRKVLSPKAAVYWRTQNFVVRMKQGSTVDDALAATGLDRQAFIRLSWRGAAWRTYKIYIR